MWSKCKCLASQMGSQKALETHWIRSEVLNQGLLCCLLAPLNPSSPWHLLVSADILDGDGFREVLLASGGWRPENLLNIPQSTARPTSENDLVLNVDSAEVQKTWIRYCFPAPTLIPTCLSDSPGQKYLWEGYSTWGLASQNRIWAPTSLATAPSGLAPGPSGGSLNGLVRPHFPSVL